MWSKLNKTRVARLIEQGLMTPAGRKMIDIAKANGMWEALNATEALTMPEDLIAALAANEAARQNFEAFAPSSKKNILWWIASAKRPETRQKRVEETVAAAAQNKRAGPFQPKKK